MNPSCDARNRTPSSTELVSGSVRSGTAVLAQIEHGHVVGPVPAVTVTPTAGASRFPLSSAARLRMRRLAEADGVNE